MPVFFEKTKINLDVNNENKYTREEVKEVLRKSIFDENSILLLDAFIDEIYDCGGSVEMSLKSNEKHNLIQSMFVNHIITFSYYDGNNYYLDPTNNLIFRMCDDSILYSDDSRAFIKPDLFENSIKNLKNMRSRIKEGNPSIAYGYERDLINNTLKLCNENIDIFEKFYLDNVELYEDVTSKMNKLKGNCLVKKR